MTDRAGRDYWNDMWTEAQLPPPLDPYAPGLGNYQNRAFHDAFSQVPGIRTSKGQRLLEIGCAKSTWLPYFATVHGLRVTGLDYSEAGCELSRRILQREGVTGEVVCADFFEPPQECIEAFDYVVSFGVAEHFEPTSRCISAFARYVKPGGIVLTTIPNMAGLNAAIQWVVNRPIYDVHVPVTAGDLASAHRHAGLSVLHCDYFELLNLGIVNFDGVTKALWVRPLSKLFQAATLFTWACIPSRLLKENRLTSPHIICVARKKDDPEADG